MIKMVVSDIDGTLLPEGTDQMNPKMYEVIRELKKKGILFVAASGRQYASIRHVFKPVAEDIIFISENGTNITQHDVDLMNKYMDPELAREVIDYTRELPDCEIMICTPRKQYLEQKNEKLVDWLRNGYHSCVEVVDDVMPYVSQANKLSIYRDAGAGVIGPQVLEQFGSRLNVAVSGSVWIDFMNPGADKKSAVERLQEKFGIKKEETMVFGDNCNDLGMFSCASETYAVATAHPRLLEKAKYVTGAPEDNGVLKVLKERLLR